MVLSFALNLPSLRTFIATVGAIFTLLGASVGFMQVVNGELLYTQGTPMPGATVLPGGFTEWSTVTVNVDQNFTLKKIRVYISLEPGGSRAVESKFFCQGFGGSATMTRWLLDDAGWVEFGYGAGMDGYPCWGLPEEGIWVQFGISTSQPGQWFHGSDPGPSGSETLEVYGVGQGALDVDGPGGGGPGDTDPPDGDEDEDLDVDTDEPPTTPEGDFPWWILLVVAGAFILVLALFKPGR